MQPAVRDTLSASVFFCSFLGLLPAQGKFVNYEDPQVKPVAIAPVGTNDYVLVCNTPDNSVEIYRAEWTLQAPIARVPVGLSPVTVKWDPATDCFFTCNYLGDSVTRVRLDEIPASGSTPASVQPVLEQTEYVGDEPTDIAFDPGTGTAVITLHASGTVRRINKGDLSAVTGPLPIAALVASSHSGNIGPYYVAGSGVTPIWVLKQARRIETLSDTRSYVLNTMGGEQSSASPYDFGMAAIVPAGSGTAIHAVGSIGSTVLGCAVNAAESRMFIVSQIAMNHGRNGVDVVNDEPTGFVQTWLKVVTLPTNGSAPTVHGDPSVTTTLPSIDLNRDYSITSPSTPLSTASRIAQVTDVVLVPNPTSGQPELIVLAGFGSDRVAILTPSTSDPSGYTRAFVAIGKQSTGSYSAAGPRGLAYSAQSSQPSSGTTGLVFVMNRLDNSLAVVNPYSPATGTVVGRALGNDPTPTSIRAGRKFLYTAAATSGGAQEKMVSCSSCHIDARTDGLRWRLGDLHDGGVIAPRLIDGFDSEVMPRSIADEPLFPKDKPETVTQTLQGLVNSHLEPDSMQWLTTNAPYHWRGDKEGFTDFNEAFVNLQGMTAHVTSPAPSGPTAIGISAGEMSDYASFINTIHHPPNPQQAWDRVYHGQLGDPNLLDDSTVNSGAQWGMKLYHVAGITSFLEGRSCVNCHSLPEGSSNTLTINVAVPSTLSSTTTGGTGGTPNPNDVAHPMETAALRNVLAREIVLPNGYAASGAPFWPINGSSGLHHGGVGSVPGTASFSLNDNIHGTFGSLPPFGPLLPNTSAMMTALTEFTRQLDTGTAPLIGFAWTMRKGDALGDWRFTLACGQADEANVGVAVYLRTGSGEFGYWYDAHQALFVEEGGSATMSADDLINELQLDTDVLIAQATPTGSERRVASLDGLGSALSGNAPSRLALLPMLPNTAFVGITALTGNIDPLASTLPFNWTPVPSTKPEPLSMATQRAFYAALVGGSYGVSTTMCHEPPRRLQVSGADIRNGAKLGLEVTSAPGVIVWFDLAATTRDNGTHPIWETAEEIDGLQTYALLCGGPTAPGVLAMLLGDLSAASSLAPSTYNLYRVHVKNDDNTTGTSSWTALTIVDAR